jgi:hypothetical protein
MMVVGMGKIRSAETFHSARPDRMPRILEEMGSLLVQSGKIFAGLAILEDGFDATAEVHALPGDQILTTEPTLLERHRHYFPALPCEDLNVLIVDEIGKTYSGTGMDTNVIGRRGVHGYEDLTQPKIKIIATLGLSAQAQGNALGVGLSDFITRRLRDSIDEKKTFINAFTTGDMQRMAIPCTLKDDEELIGKINERFSFQKGGKPGKAMNLLMGLLGKFKAEKFTDNDRFYVGGLSMGAMGTFELLRRKPNAFASAFAICGGDHVENVKKYKKENR